MVGYIAGQSGIDGKELVQFKSLSGKKKLYEGVPFTELVATSQVSLLIKKYLYLYKIITSSF